MSFRKEKKFRVTVSDFYKFQDQLYQQGMETLFEPRLITSVYFDTVDLNMFHDSEEGVLPRKKVRIRWYNDDQLFTLENKTSSIEGRFKVTSKLENSISENKARPVGVKCILSYARGLSKSISKPTILFISLFLNFL